MMIPNFINAEFGGIFKRSGAVTEMASLVLLLIEESVKLHEHNFGIYSIQLQGRKGGFRRTKCLSDLRDLL